MTTHDAPEADALVSAGDLNVSDPFPSTPGEMLGVAPLRRTAPDGMPDSR